MKTQKGFCLFSILDLILYKGVEKWEDNCSHCAGGARSYEDPLHGEQSFIYEFKSGKLKLSISTTEPICICSEETDCECLDTVDLTYECWADYWEATHEVITLSKKEAKSILEPNLFNCLLA